MAPDPAPRTVKVPKDPKAAPAKNPAAVAMFDKLSCPHRKEFVEWIEQAKKTETRSARVEKTVAMVLQKERVKG